MRYQENKMFSDLIKKAETHYQNGLPFVLYRKPGDENVLGIFQNNTQLNTTSDYKSSGFVFAPFDNQGKTILLLADEMITATYIVADERKRTYQLTYPGELERKKHLDLIGRAINQINTGHLKKVVLSRKTAFDTIVKPLSVFQEILALYSGALCYLWYHPGVGLWAGASPEIFLNIADDSLTTMALAGTQKSIDDSPPVWGSKEVEEQAMVTSFILDAIRDKVSNLSSTEVVSVRAGNLWHLKTTITANMKGTSLKTIVNALHPTPAVCGLPLKEAQKFLSQYEEYDREYYTGFLGELNLGKNSNSQLYVNLRCMQIRDTSVILYIGGGITRDSVPENEWQETLDKTGIMARALFNSNE